jgi:hypothetical protein
MPDIKKFFNDPRCSVCGRPVKGWATAHCDNCGRTVCRRHRPLFVQFWQCPSCQQRQQVFISQPQSLPPASATPENMIQAASEHIEANRTAEAKSTIDALFADLFGDKKQ